MYLGVRVEEATREFGKQLRTESNANSRRCTVRFPFNFV